MHMYGYMYINLNDNGGIDNNNNTIITTFIFLICVVTSFVSVRDE